VTQRKKKANITFELMSVLLRVGATGIVANARFADSHKWSQPGLHLAVQKLCEKGVVICTSNGQDKRVTIGSNIQSHSDWMLAYYDGKVPPRYQKYIATAPAVAPSQAEPIYLSDEKMPERVRQIIEERDQLRADKSALEERVLDLQIENKRMSEILMNELEALKKAFDLMRKNRQQ
jgi:hypothetical protein